MKVLVILGHPRKGSFNHAIAETVAKTLRNNNHEVIFHDLYEERFDPILPYDEMPKGSELNPVIKNHCDEAVNADGIIIIHPNWWEQPPAILKGWVDRVLCLGVAYEFTEKGILVGLLKAKTALVFNTSNTPEEREMNYFEDPLERIWGKCTLEFCGIKNFFRKMYKEVAKSTPEQRQIWLKDVENIVNNYFIRSLNG